MATVHESINIHATPDTVWALIGSPDAISDWHPAIATSPVSAGVRRCTLEGGGSLVEPIVEHSDGARFYVYEVAEGPFPMSFYHSRIAVEDAEGGSRVVWQADFEPDDPKYEPEMVETFAGIYRAGLDVVRSRCEA